MKKFASDLEIGDKFQTDLFDEVSRRRIKEDYIVTGEVVIPSEQFNMYVNIPCINSNGKFDNLLLFADNMVKIL